MECHLDRAIAAQETQVSLTGFLRERGRLEAFAPRGHSNLPFDVRGGSPRIHAGELGFQAERLA